MGKTTEEKYINNLAKSIVGKLKITVKDLEDHGVPALYEWLGKEIRVLLHQMKPATLGKIAAYGKPNGREKFDYEKTTLYRVMPEKSLSTRFSGKDLLINIACAAIIAEIVDILKAKKTKTA
jgi:hypothetical protein